MNECFERHPLVTYMLIIALLLSLNIFFRWRNDGSWSDVLLLSFFNTLVIGGGVIAGNHWRRKQNQKNAAAKEKIDERLKKE